MNAVTAQPDRDAALEMEIDAAYERMIKAPTDHGSREAFTEMAVLIRRRSPAQVLRMELERRLARRQAKQ